MAIENVLRTIQSKATNVSLWNIKTDLKYNENLKLYIKIIDIMFDQAFSLFCFWVNMQNPQNNRNQLIQDTLKVVKSGFE